MTLSVAHVSFSSSGGAGAVASRLAKEQNRRGMASRVFSVIDRDLRSKPLSAPIHTTFAALDQYIIRHPNFDSPISALRNHARGLDWRQLEEFDVLHLHGINGALDLKTVAERVGDARVVWTLHDMNPFTGVCHFALGCDGFTRACGNCPATRTIFQPMVEKSLAEKKHVLQEFKQLSLVSPSRWLAAEAARSSLFADQEIVVINNPVGEEFFESPPARKAQVAEGGLIVGVIAQNLSDPRKNVGEAHRAFLGIIDKGIVAQMFLIGTGGGEFVGPNVQRLGGLAAKKIVPHLDSWDVLINPSRAENAPLVIGEAASRGCCAFVADEGGMASMVSDLGGGSSYNSEAGLTALLEAQAHLPHSVRHQQGVALAARARELYSVPSVVDAYLEVYQK